MNTHEDIVNCPFDSVHRIIKGRLQQHIVKCSKNFPKNTKLVCPFDATHWIDPMKYEDHISKCTTSGNVKCYQHSLEPKYTVGTVSLEQACSIQTTTIDEDWSGNSVAYNPETASEKKNVVRMQIGLSKAKKKQFKQLERKRIEALEKEAGKSNCNKNIIEETDFERPLRAPKKAAMVTKYNSTDQNNVNDLSCTVDQLSVSNNSNSIRKKDDCIKNNITPKKAASQKENEKICTKNNNVTVIPQNVTEIKKENILEIKNDLEANTYIPQDNSYKTQENYAKSNMKKETLQLNLKKENSFESQNSIHSNPEMAARFYKEAKKISTGRGFTIAYRHLNSAMLKAGKQNESTQNFNSVYDDDED